MRPGLFAALGAALSLLAVGGSQGEGEPAIMPLAEVVAGQRGLARTVLEGTRRVEIPLEILGISRGFNGPGRDIILARLAGPEADHLGVAAGMSGSPVLVDGRLVGALSFRLGSFTTEAVAGITPIEEMLSIPEERTEGPQVLAPGAFPLLAALGLETWPAPATTALEGVPVAVSGLGSVGGQALESILRQAGLEPRFAALSGPLPQTGDRLAPGDAVAAILVRGDMTVAATGTVTAVQGDRILAFGHPVTRVGAVDFPMAAASILVTVPSLAGSFKVAQVGEPLGSFSQDRPAGVAGWLGRTARLLPVTINLMADGAAVRRRQFQVVRTPGLTPALVNLVVAAASSSADDNSQHGMVMLRLRADIGALPALALETMFASRPPEVPVDLQAARFAAAVTEALLAVPGGEAALRHLEVDLLRQPQARQYTLEAVHLAPARPASGDRLEITAILREAVTGEERRQVFSLDLPEASRGQQLELIIGAGQDLLQTDAGATLAAVSAARDVASLAAGLDRLPAAHALQLRLTRAAPGWLVGPQALADLPPSVAAVMAADASARERPPLLRTELVRREHRQDGVVIGSRRLPLVIQ